MSKKLKKTIWLIDDGRIGNLNQLKAIAYFLEKNHFLTKLIKVKFNFLINLPNFISYCAQNCAIAHIDYAKEKPDAILSVGRRSALISLEIKKKHPEIKLIQLMRPNLPASLFDFIITPNHDKFKSANLEIATPPSPVNNDILAQESKKFSSLQKDNLVSFIIGGDSKKKKLSLLDYEKLLETIKSLAKNHSIYLITSRRTNYADFLTNNLPKNCKIFKWQDCQKQNPYLAILAFSKYLIVTQDSISMIADCLASKKSTYIYQENFGSKKHQEFAENLIKSNYAKKLEQNSLKNFTTNLENSAKEISSEIIKLL